RYLDDQRRPGRMPAHVVAGVAGDHGQIGFGLGVLVEGDRTRRTHVPAVTERALERALRQLERDQMGRALRLTDDEQPVDQLDAVVGLEKPPFNETLVLDAAQTSGRDRRCGPHDFTTLYGAGAAGQCPHFDTAGPSSPRTLAPPSEDGSATETRQGPRGKGLSRQPHPPPP